MIGILGASQYEAALEQQHERTVVTTRFGDVSVLRGSIGDQEIAYVRRFGLWDDTRSFCSRRAGQSVVTIAAEGIVHAPTRRTAATSLAGSAYRAGLASSAHLIGQRQLCRLSIARHTHRELPPRAA